MTTTFIANPTRDGKNVPAASGKITVAAIDWDADAVHVRSLLNYLMKWDATLRRTWLRQRTDLPEQRGYRYDLALVSQLFMAHGRWSPTDLALALRLFHEKHGRSNKSRDRRYIVRTIGRALADG